MTFTLKSTPMVAEISSGARKTPSTKRMSRLLFPVPLLPMRSSLSVATVSEDEEWFESAMLYVDGRVEKAGRGCGGGAEIKERAE